MKDDVVSEPSASESEADDTYGGQRGRTFAKKHRQRLQAATSGRDTPNLSEVRFSTRRAAKVTTYNEDDDLGLSEEDTENLTPNYWTYVDDTSPAIDSVLNHRLKDGTGQCIHPGYTKLLQLTCFLDSTDPDKHDFEFFVSNSNLSLVLNGKTNKHSRSNGKVKHTTMQHGKLGRA